MSSSVKWREACLPPSLPSAQLFNQEVLPFLPPAFLFVQQTEHVLWGAWERGRSLSGPALPLSFIVCFPPHRVVDGCMTLLTWDLTSLLFLQYAFTLGPLHVPFPLFGNGRNLHFLLYLYSKEFTIFQHILGSVFPIRIYLPEGKKFLSSSLV